MMASSAIPEINRFGLTEVYSPTGPANVDIIFVHGLNGNPHNTWTSVKSKVFWPAQLLPPLLEEEKARVLVYGYDADVTSFTDGVSHDKIHNHAEHLTAELAANRRIRKATERPIVFVAHSLGGLVVKRALIYSSEIRGNYTEHLRSIFVSTYGMLFLGTPHKGSDVAKWGSRLGWIAEALPKKAIDYSPQLVESLKKDNETLQNIDRQFIQLMSRFHIYFFHEGKPTDLKGTMQFIVDEESASPNVQDIERAVIQADHSHMCKFENNNAPGFDLVAEGIQRYSGEAPSTINTRWAAEKSERIAKKKAEVEELFPGSKLGRPHTDSTSTKSTSSGKEQLALPSPEKQSPMQEACEVEEYVEDTSPNIQQQDDPQPDVKDMATNTSPTKTAEPYFIVPPGFRANAICVGRDKELEELGRRLFDVKRRRDGTACVLLHGQPGGGKTHLARQYVNKNRKKFTGGVFWITAKSKEERYHAFWNIKQKVVCRDKPHLCDGVNGDDFVPTVKSWFEARQEWLLIFDGITVEREDDATELAKFIPDSQNSSIIYISWAKNLEFNQRLFRPHPIKVGPLNEADAKRLLFKELHMKKPTEGEKRKATDLVRKIGGLPLAINAISRRLADTHEPLTKYKLSCSADPTIEGTYNKILDDLQRLGHMEAWNLVHILCWFAQEIPVEMVHLGLRILRTEDVEVRATQAGGRPDINTTFGQLMRYALIERNEPDDRESMSSSRDSLVDPEPIDMLKIHTVVQNYCCDSLSSRNMLPQWLGYAVKLFSFSYYQADMKIKQKPDTGRVSDYRYYKVHGQRLFDHALHYEARMQSLERIRVTLQPTLNMIDDEILLREPSASQESLQEGNGIFQVSIFDRTSSSSDSGPGPITPDHRPTPPPLGNETLFGFPLGKPMDSPASFGTASPGIRPKIVDLSPGRRLPADADYGYEGDREGQRTSHPMEPKLSDTTARHSSRSPTSSIGSPSDSWQVVPPSWKTRKSRGRRDLGSFRPTAARAKVDTRSATGSVTPSNRDVKSPRETSPAFKSLKRVQSRRPPSSQSGVSSFWQRGPLTCPPTVANQPTWAAVAAKDPSQQQHQEPQSAPARPVPSPMITERGRSRESLNARPSPAPLASKFVPYQRTAGTYETKNFLISPASPGHTHEYPPAGLTYLTPYPGSNSGLAQTIQGPPTDIYLNPYSAPPARLGPNPASLAIEEGITTSKRPLPSEFSEQQLTQYFPTLPSGHLSQSPPSRTSPHQPYQQTYDASYPVPTMPSGYTSQPMSQQGSHQSYNSVAETDPIQYPSSFSPQIAPIHSSRDRHSDGSPYRKSPKTDFALPVSAAFASPQTSPYDLSHAGGWAYPPSPSHSAPGLHDTSMSRSSSGPGLAIEGTPGGIVRFEDAGSVQFGEHQPISMEEARRRMGEHEVHLQERQRKGDAWERREEADSRRGSSAPYPEHSLIPTGSDGVALEDMVGGRRVSGNSQNGAVGLGMDMG